MLDKINITLKQYFLRIFLPYTLAGFITGIFIINYAPSRILRIFGIMVFFLGLLYSLIYPLLQIDRRKNEIESVLHFFITDFGVLSTSEVDRKEMLKILSEESELKYLAKEIKKIHVLIAKWNRSLAEACRFISKRTPSKIFSDFLDRFAYSVDSGEDMEKFLLKEQNVVMNDYENFYTGALYDLDVFKEIYVSILISLAFFVSFVIIIPLLLGVEVLKISLIVLGVFFIAELLLTYAIKMRMPFDPTWHSADVVTKIDMKLMKYYLLSLLLSAGIGTVIYLSIDRLKDLPFQYLVAASVTPMAVVGVIARNEEQLIKKKDENFPAFLRSLGGSLSSKGGMITSLKYLTTHDFGPLTRDIRELYRRINMRIDMKKSWRIFGTETGSKLIEKFSKTFIESIYLGSEPGKVSDIIATNFSRLLNIRKRKFQQTMSFIGIAYGLTVALAFTIAVSFEVARIINKLYSNLNLETEAIRGILYSTPQLKLQTVIYVIFFILLIHSFFSSVLIKIMDGGHLLHAELHFVGMTWVSAVIVHVTNVVINALISTKPAGV